MSDTNQDQGEPITVSDAEWAQLQRDATTEPSATPDAPAVPAQAEAAAPAHADAPEWNARDWLAETFKDDPAFKDLTPEEYSRLEALANERHEEFAGEVQEWAQEKGTEWGQEMKAGLEEGMGSNPELQQFMETRLADGEFSDADKAELQGIAKDLTPQEAAGVVKPIVEAVHEIHGEIIDGVEVIVDHAIEDINEIVEARAEMTGGDNEQVQTMLTQLEEAPGQVHDALNWEREQADREWGKVEDRIELIEAGTDPKDLPADTDTYQVDDNADQYETADA